MGDKMEEIRVVENGHRKEYDFTGISVVKDPSGQYSTFYYGFRNGRHMFSYHTHSSYTYIGFWDVETHTYISFQQLSHKYPREANKMMAIFLGGKDE